VQRQSAEIEWRAHAKEASVDLSSEKLLQTECDGIAISSVVIELEDPSHLGDVAIRNHHVQDVLTYK